MVFEHGRTNGRHKTHNGCYLGLVGPISSIVGLLILYSYAPINYLPHYPPGATCGEGKGIFLSFEQNTCPKGGEFDLILEIIF